MYKKVRQLLRDYVRKDFVQDKFDGNYPFGLSEIPNTKYVSFSDKNPDKVFYVIYRTPLEAGFFSNFSHVTGHLKQIEGKDLIPIVDFENFKTFYNTENPINGTKNSWEYYFEQPSGYTLEEVYQSKNVLFCDGMYPHSATYSDQELFDWHNKVFKVKKYILEEIEEKYGKEFAGKKVLGVHFRGKDMNIYPQHPFGPTEEQMFKYTDEIFEKFNVEKIFLATDEKKYLEAFVNRYGKKVFFADNFRTEKINEFNINPRENHRYLLGKEVLTDLILLTKCDGILCGNSNVAATARILKPFEFVYYVNNGKNSSNKYYARFLYGIKKRLPKNFGGLLDKIEITVNKRD